LGLSKYHIKYTDSSWADGSGTVRRADQNSDQAISYMTSVAYFMLISG